MADETIGSVGVEVRADYSDLSADFDQAVSIAVAAGATLAEAIQQAMQTPDSTPMTDAFTQVGEAADAAAEQLALFGAAEDNIPFAEASGQLNIFTTELETFTTAEEQAAAGADTAAAGLARVEESLKNAGVEAQHSMLSLGELTEKLLEISGIVFSIEKVKEFGEQVLEVAADEQKFSVSMTALTGSAQAAAEALHHVEEFSFKNALPIEEVEKVTQKMTALGFSVDQVELSMQAAANAARATGTDFASTSAAIERMALSGMAGARQLVALGLSAADLAAAMGTTEAAAKKAFKALDESERVEVLTRALSKFAGVSEAAANTLSGAWTNTQNQIRLVLADMGTAIAPAAEAILHFAQDVAVPYIGSIVKEWAGAATAAKNFASVVIESVQSIVGPIVAFTGAINGAIDSVPGLRTALQGLGAVYTAITSPIAVARKELEYLTLTIETLTGKIPGAKAMHDALAASIQHLSTVGTSAGLAIHNSGDQVAEAIEKITDTQHKLANNVTVAKEAYDRLNQAYQTGTPLANGYKVSSEDVARALANLTAAQAAAATTTQIHADKTRGHVIALRAMQPAVQALVDQLKLEEGAYNRSVQATAAYNSAMAAMTTGVFKALTPLQFATKQVADFGKELEKTVLGAPMQDWPKAAEASAAAMDAVGQSVDAANQAAITADGSFGQLAAGLQALGIKGKQYYAEQVDIAQKAYDDILHSGKATDDELAIAAAMLAQKQAEYALAAKEITVEQYREIVDQINTDLDQLEGNERNSRSRRLSDEERFGQQIQEINHRTFDSLERGLAQSIVQLKGFGDLWKQLWQKLAEDLLQIMFKTLLNPLEKALGGVLGKISGGGGGGGVATIGGGGGGVEGVAGQAAGAAASMGVSAIVGMVTGAVTAISSVVGNFQMAHMSSDLQKIEESTRYLKGYTGEQSDSLLATAHINRDTLYDILGALDGVVKINLDGKISSDEANKLVDNLLNGSMNFYQRTYDTFQKLLQATTSGFAQVVGQLHAIGKDLNPPLWKSLLGGLGGGIGGAASGAAGGIGSLLGGIAGLFTGGGTNWQALIEENTRFTKILIDQNLNVVAVQSVLHTGQLDAIGGTLWKIYDAINDAAKMAIPAAASQASAVTVHMHQPRIGRLTSPSEVSAIFQEGIQQAKDAGAFRVGVFPV